MERAAFVWSLGVRPQAPRENHVPLLKFGMRCAMGATQVPESIQAASKALRMVTQTTENP